MGATKREVAEKLGVAKQTVVNYISKLGLESHVSRVGKTDVLDEFAVSAIADAVGKSIPPTSAPKDDGVTTSSPRSTRESTISRSRTPRSPT